MQEQKLINLAEEPAAKLKTYLTTTRKNSRNAPSLKEITAIVEEAGAQRYVLSRQPTAVLSDALLSPPCAGHAALRGGKRG
jgi:hypothetical protein